MNLTITGNTESIGKKAKKPKTLAYYCKGLSVNKHEQALPLKHSFASMDYVYQILLGKRKH